jgi:hypothetical protein
LRKSLEFIGHDLNTEMSFSAGWDSMKTALAFHFEMSRLEIKSLLFGEIKSYYLEEFLQLCSDH